MELELKFALPAPDPLLLQKQLARVPGIGRRKPQRERLHNTYYDTPDHALKNQGMALRVRQLGTDAAPHWVQTLKVGGASQSALSSRGEWEHALPSPTLDAGLLQGTPWAQYDPQGQIFNALVAVFTTDFERLRWVVDLPGAQVEVALDRGAVQMDGHAAPLCELEIELLQGPPQALFDMARQIAQHVALLPAHMSKAERAYRLAQGTVYAPRRASPPALDKPLGFEALATGVLRECFLQFTANLGSLLHSDAPEVLHQARVGWRRFKSMRKLLRQTGEPHAAQDGAALQPLLAAMARLRDLDVAATEVFPLMASAYQAGDAQRAQQWQQLEAALEQARSAQRHALRGLLAEPALGHCLLLATSWLEMGPMHPPKGLTGHKPAALEDWLRKRVKQVAKALQAVPPHSKDVAQQHAMRILCKRLRYSVESLQPLLPPKKARRWLRLSTQQQTRIGLERDRLLAIDIATQLGAAPGIVDFLRGAAFGAGVCTTP